MVDETLDTTIEDQLIEAEGNEEDEEQAEVDIEDDGDEADEAQGEGEEGQVQEEAVFEEEEQMDTADPEEPVDEAETQAVGGDDEVIGQKYFVFKLKKNYFTGSLWNNQMLIFECLGK